MKPLVKSVCIRRTHIKRRCKIRDTAPAPRQAGEMPQNSAFGGRTGCAAKKMGVLEVLEEFSMRKPREYFDNPVVHYCSSRQNEQETHLRFGDTVQAASTSAIVSESSSWLRLPPRMPPAAASMRAVPELLGPWNTQRQRSACSAGATSP